MNTRSIPFSTIPCKNQSMSITLSNGKTYGIVVAGQLSYMLQKERQRILDEAYDTQTTLTEEQIKAKLDVFQENCGFATLDWVLEKLPPNKREEWKNQYRFSGVTRRLGQQ